MEPMSAALITFGLAILLVSWVMLLITSFREDITWGYCTLFLPPLSYLYGLFRCPRPTKRSTWPCWDCCF